MINILEKYKSAIERNRINWTWLHNTLSREFGGDSTRIDKVMEEIKSHRIKLGLPID